MKLASRIFTIAGIWGVVALLPLYFLEDRLGREFPPAITHPEMFYGFVGVGLAWQVAFLIIGRDPVRFRPLMPAAMIEKFSFVGAILTLYAKGRVPGLMVPVGLLDGTLGVLFVVAYLKTAGLESSGSARAEGLA